MSISNYYENEIIAALCLVADTVSLHTGDPGETGANNEVTGGTYARQSVTLTNSGGGAATNSTAALDFTGMPACTVTHAALWDASNNCLWSGTATNRTLGAGDTYQIGIGDLDVAVD
jgi:hypothetical protein